MEPRFPTATDLRSRGLASRRRLTASTRCLLLYRGDPNAGGQLVSPRSLLPLGRYWWRVRRQRGDYPTVTSETRSFQVVPGPADHLRVRSYNEGDYRGRTRLAIATTPYARISARIFRGRHRVWRRTRIQPPGHKATGKTPLQRLAFRWSCRKPGTYRYLVTARGRGGRTLRKSKKWTVQSCTALRARDRAGEKAYQQEQAARRARDHQRRAQCGRAGGVYVDGHCWRWVVPLLPVPIF